jgi:hypothetical protein
MMFRNQKLPPPDARDPLFMISQHQNKSTKTILFSIPFTVHNVPVAVLMAWCLMGLLCLGCGTGDGIQRVAISGTVTYQGQPVDNGFITFTPIDNGIQSGARILHGKYEASGPRGSVPVGKYQVRISWLKEDPSLQEDGMPVPPQVNILPAKYHADSELQLTVTSDKRKVTQDFILD